MRLCHPTLLLYSGAHPVIAGSEYCLTTTYFQYGGEYYQQREGAAMGSPLSPIVANIFMEDFENKAISSFDGDIDFWQRYVDDVVSEHDEEDSERLLSHLNSQHEKIKFTCEPEKDGKLPALDVLLLRNNDGTLDTKVYRKPTHTNQYMNFNSSQPLQHKLGVIRTLNHRADTNVTREEDRQEEKKLIKDVLAVNDYPEWTHKVVARRETREANPRSNNAPNTRKGHVALPYVPGVTESLQRLFRSHGIQAHAKPYNTIRSMVVCPKDRTPTQERADTVYHITCATCNSQYTGESGQPLAARLKQHHREASPVGRHMRQTGHTIDWEGTKILDREANWFRRGVKEAIHIRRRHPDLNLDQGRHHLPHCWDTLLSQRSRSNERGRSSERSTLATGTTTNT